MPNKILFRGLFLLKVNNVFIKIRCGAVFPAAAKLQGVLGRMRRNCCIIKGYVETLNFGATVIWFHF